MFGRSLIGKLIDCACQDPSHDGVGCLPAAKRRSDLGQAMVETAMVILVLLLILMAFFDLGRAVVIYASMTAAAQDAAHMGALTSNTGVIQTAATDRLALKLIQEINRPYSTSPDTELTERELQILRLVAQGLSNQDISQTLTISERTVGTHISNILNKLQLANRTQAALYALRRGIAILEPE